MKSGKHHKQLTYENRIMIEALYKAKHTKREIAEVLNIHISTVYRETKRGLYKRLNGDTWEYNDEYSADIANNDKKKKQASKGAPLKIGKDYDFANYIETMIVEKKYSPDAVIGMIKAKGLSFNTVICTKTLYNYINNDLFLKLTNKSLPMHGLRKQHYNKVRRVRVYMPRCRSIESRPKEANERQFGHWEMDTVVGKKSTPQCLLVLTERKTREEIIMKLKANKQTEVQKALDKIERHYGKRFPQIFRTITTDNGKEFLNADIIENSCYGRNRKRTTLYYCHPYSSYERGSNENANGIIRRFIPKGEEIEKYTDRQINNIQTWMNDYPRKILEYRSSHEVFMQELEKNI